MTDRGSPVCKQGSQRASPIESWEHPPQPGRRGRRMAPGSTQRLSGAEGVCCRGGGTRPSVSGSPPNPLLPYHLPSEPPSTRVPSCRPAACGEPAGAASASSPAPWPRRSGPSFRQRSEAWGPPNLEGEESVALPAHWGGAGPARPGSHLALVTRAARCVSSSSQRSSSSSKGWMWSLQQASNSAAPGYGRVHVGPMASRPQSVAAPESPRGLTLSSSASTLKLISAILSNGALRGQQGHRHLHQEEREAAPSGPEGRGQGRHTAGSQPGRPAQLPSPEGTSRPWGHPWHPAEEVV